MPSRAVRRRRAITLVTLAALITTLVVVLWAALTSGNSPESRACQALLQHPSTSAVLGSAVTPTFSTTESVDRRIELMDSIEAPAAVAESWTIWRAHLERARTDLSAGVVQTQGLVWFPASPAVAQAGEDIMAMYRGCA